MPIGASLVVEMSVQCNRGHQVGVLQAHWPGRRQVSIGGAHAKMANRCAGATCFSCGELAGAVGAQWTCYACQHCAICYGFSMLILNFMHVCTLSARSGCNKCVCSFTCGGIHGNQRNAARIPPHFKFSFTALTHYSNIISH
jgi:hypothetical protein